MQTICEITKCTGCFACKNICPKNAISIKYDKLGKTVPEINQDLCISCNACKRVCPVIQKPELKRPMTVYAAWSKNQKDVELSSSGGIATALSRKVIESGGIVFGTSSEGVSVKYIKAETLEDLERLRGSKYVQSDIGYIYREVRNELKTDRKVLFIGTPCQVAGMKGYIGHEEKNLITVDLICHGTPPMKYLKEHLESCIRGEWTQISFRGEYDYILTAFNQKKMVYQKKSFHDIYFAAFLKNLILRDNCYQCRYACIERISDITVGDFWGIKRNTLIHPYTGKISLVFINTNYGNTFFKENCKELVYEERSIEEAANPAQGNLLYPSKQHKDRKVFEINYQKYGFEKAVKKTDIAIFVRKNRMKDTVRNSIPYRILRKVKNILLICRR